MIQGTAIAAAPTAAAPSRRHSPVGMPNATTTTANESAAYAPPGWAMSEAAASSPMIPQSVVSIACVPTSSSSAMASKLRAALYSLGYTKITFGTRKPVNVTRAHAPSKRRRRSPTATKTATMATTERLSTTAEDTW